MFNYLKDDKKELIFISRRYTEIKDIKQINVVKTTGCLEPSAAQSENQLSCETWLQKPISESVFMLAEFDMMLV